MPNHVTVDVNANRHENVPDEEFHDGPPGEDPQIFRNLGNAAKTQAWVDWFDDGGTLSSLSAARKMADSILRDPNGNGNDIPLQSTQYGQSSFSSTTDVVVPVTQIYGAINAVAPPTETISIPDNEYDLGPPDESGKLDPQFSTLDHAAKQQIWLVEMREPRRYRPNGGDVGALRRKDIVVQTKEALEHNPYPLLDNKLQKLSVAGARNPKAANTAITGYALLQIGALAGLGYLAYFLAKKLSGGLTPPPPSTPTNVTIKATTEQQTNRVSVHWSYSKGTGTQATHFKVQLNPDTGDALMLTTADAQAKSVEFTNVPDGNWTAVVAAFAAEENSSGTAESSEFVLPIKQTGVVTTSPGKPTQIDTREVFSPTKMKRVLIVSWSAPSGTPVPDSYTVSMEGLAPVIPEITSAKQSALEITFDDLVPGQYSIAIEAFAGGNSSGRSAAKLVTYSGIAPNKPSVPTGLDTKTFVPTGATKSSVTILWSDAPATDEVIRHRVTLKQGSTTIADKVSIGGMETFESLADGAYTLELFAINSAGESPAATKALTISSTVDAKNIDWSERVGQAQIDAWQSMTRTVSAMDEDTEFWPFILPLLASSGQPPKPTSFEEQLIFVSLLTQWIAIPPELPLLRRREFWATLLRDLTGDATSATRFPDAPPTTEYAGDPLILWKQAQNLTLPNGMRLSLKNRLFAIQQALNEYLGANPPPMG